MKKLDQIATQLMGALLVAQGESNNVADHGLDRIDEVLGMRWIQLLGIIRTPSSYPNNVVRARDVVNGLIDEIERIADQTLNETAFTARRTTRRAFFDSLPEELQENQVIGGLLEARAPKRRLKKRTVKPLTENEVLKIVRSGRYGERLRRWANTLTRADKVARILAQGIANELSPNEIAASVAPYVKNYVDAAKRIVKTESARIHNEVLENTFLQYDDLIVGYQIIAVLDARTRPHHATRHGKIFYTYKAPYASDRPTLPDEPNCRCTYTVLLRDGVRGHGIPAPSTRLYSTWFDRQSIATKQKIVGKARWNAVREKISNPSWNDFINPSTGRLIKTDTLERKSATEILRTRDRIDTRQRRQAEIARGYK